VLSDKTHAVYRDLKGDSGFEGFRGSQKKGFRDSGIKNKAAVKFRFKYQALAICAALMTLATTGWGQSNPTAHNLASTSFTFTGFASTTTTTYPTSMQGWTFGGTEASSTTTGAASADQALVANSDTITTGSIRNEGTSGISLLSTGTVGLGAICVSVNSTERTSLQVTWTAADMITTATRIMGVKLQYRVGTSGSFTDVASTIYTSTSGSAAAAQTFSNIALPAGAENRPVVQIRWLYYFSSGSGNRDRIRIDDITISSSARPTITAIGTLSAVNTTYGTASASPTSFSVSGANMGAGITVTPPAGFEVSTSSTFASGVGSNATPITVGAAGTIASTTVYVRLAANASVVSSPYSGNIVLTSTGATSVNVATASSTVSKATPNLSITSASTAVAGGAVSLTSSSPAASGAVSASTGAISYTSSSTGVATISTATLTAVAAGTTTITASQLADSNYNAASATQTFTVTASSGTLSTSTGSLSALTATPYGTASPPANFTVNGTGLDSSGVTVTPPAGFEVSTTSNFAAVGTFASPLSLGTSATLSITVYVRLAASTVPGSYSGNISVAGGAASTQTVAIASSTVTKANQPAVSGSFAASTITFGQTGSVTGSGGSGTGAYELRSTGGTATVTISGATISPTTVGTADIEIRRLGDAIYNASEWASVGTFTINKANQIISSVETTVTKTFGDPNYSLGASVNSGLTLSFSSDNSAVATVNSAGLVTIVGVGSANISVSQAGNDNYNAATSATQALTVNRANQTITFGALATKLTTDSSFTLNATASSGGAVTYTSSNTSVATVLGNTVTIVGAGTTTITASAAASGNYNAASASQGLIVDVPPTTLAAGDVAVIGYNASGTPDMITFLVLKTLSAGTVFYVCDNEVATVGGTAFADTSEVEATFTVSPGQTIPAGTVVTLPWGNQTVTDSRFTWTGHTSGGLGVTSGNFDDGIYIYTGTSATATPTAFIYFVKGGSSAATAGNLPAGLSYGTTAINPTAAASRYKISGVTYSGSVDQLLAATGNIATNWEASAPGAVTDWTFSILQPQTITFGSLPAKTYGDASFDLTASASSGLSVSYVSANTAVATVSGSTITIVGAGTTTITASQTGNSSYAVATSVQQTLTVGKAAQTITGLAATDDSKTYGGIYMDFDLTATKGASTSALSYSSSNTSVATIHPTTGSVHIVGAGTTTLTVNQAADANYNAAPAVTQILTVGKAAITLAADAKSKTYGASDPVLTYTITSGALVVGDSLTGGLSRAPGANVGTYAISSTLANANYDVTFVPASLTITAATVASSDITMTPAGDGSYTASATGGASFTYSYVGRNQTSYGPSATAPTGAGFYSVTASATGNYSGSNSADFSITGPMAIADSLTKPADNEPYMIPVSELLTNDFRITSTSGATVTTGLSVSAVTGGAGNTASYNVGDRFIQFTPSSGASDTFTYTVTDGVSTATATVTVTTETQAPSFNLQIVKVGTAIFAGGNTTITHDFIGVPNQTYLVEYTTDLNGTWTSAGNQSTGTTGSFSVTFTTSGDVAADWTARMFFRARLVR